MRMRVDGLGPWGNFRNLLLISGRAEGPNTASERVTCPLARECDAPICSEGAWWQFQHPCGLEDLTLNGVTKIVLENATVPISRSADNYVSETNVVF